MKKNDDFNWDSYTKDDYQQQVVRLIKEGVYELGDFDIIDGELVFSDECTLHANFKEIYRLVYELGVDSVFECGCGSSYNLININKIMPNVKVSGCDYSQTQIDLGYEYFDMEKFPYKDNISTKDFVYDENIEELGKHEFVFTQAVTMHLRDDKARKFLKNMGKISSRYIFLVENVSNHNYNELIKECLPDFKLVDNKRYINFGILVEKI